MLGYSYETSSTEIALFEIDRLGRIEHIESYAIQSSDYYSFENYGSRLVNGDLVLYVPIDLAGYGAHAGSIWPSYATYGRSKLSDHWTPLVESMEILRPIQSNFPTTLHSVVTCGVKERQLTCDATGFIGSFDATHYVSRSATYVWVAGGRSDFDLATTSPHALRRRAQENAWSLAEIAQSGPRKNDALIYRLPFDGSEIGILEMEGRPLNQFSFRESKHALDLLVAIAPLDADRVGHHLGHREWIHAPLDRFYAPDGFRAKS